MNEPMIRNLRRHFRLFVLYFGQYAKARLEYRADFFSSVLASFLGTAAAFGFTPDTYEPTYHIQYGSPGRYARISQEVLRSEIPC